ncbi:MAG: putative transrane protein [Proteobacteria bacterium]|nr:putative transrane protein [Pseudomonadota bacterium]
MRAPSPYASPLFDPLRRWLEQLPAGPDTGAVAELARRFPITTENGRTVRFVPPQADGLAYECRIWESGEVETRPDNWHDFFNALVWFAFPRTKIAVSARHVRAMTPAGAPRGAARDALTHFDECGIVVLSSRPQLLDLLRNFAWKTLFVEQRAAVQQCMRFVVFGHATYEQLLKPYRGLTAKAILYEVGEDWFGEPAAAQCAALDSRLAADLGSGRYARPGDFQPLPLLAIPGLTPANDDPAYYDDTWQFRPGRRSAAPPPA